MANGGSMNGLAIGRKVDESVVIDLRQFGLGLINILRINDSPDRKRIRLLFNAERRIPIHRKEVFDAIERGEKPRVRHDEDDQSCAGK